ncbi:hypothetical protein ANN_17376 [Periplaneta americana]|uniref:Uncharacterized protein n=1 Tax=Periplaneta americana TaxID=6978 RepID=A0ABQ8STZ5_PERAM|nr:hypothetical protein ANN_17376 [Periplaneta americana]
MVGLCEGSNEPSGSLKAICKTEAYKMYLLDNLMKKTFVFGVLYVSFHVFIETNFLRNLLVILAAFSVTGNIFDLVWNFLPKRMLPDIQDKAVLITGKTEIKVKYDKQRTEAYKMYLLDNLMKKTFVFGVLYVSFHVFIETNFLRNLLVILAAFSVTGNIFDLVWNFLPKRMLPDIQDKAVLITELFASGVALSAKAFAWRSGVVIGRGFNSRLD